MTIDGCKRPFFFYAIYIQDVNIDFVVMSADKILQGAFKEMIWLDIVESST